MEAIYREVLSKVCSNLVYDVLLRRKDPKYPPTYTVEVVIKESTDSQARRASDKI